MARLPVGRLFAGAALLAAACLAFMWAVPSGHYLYVPGTARPLADKVEVEGEVPDDDGGGIHYVDVTIRQATWPERLLAFARPEGATLVPEDVVSPHGESFEERRVEARAEMERSEQVAAAVALAEAGLKVSTKPLGALVEAVSPDVPAAGELLGGDVIVSVDGKAVRTPGDLRDAISTRQPGDPVSLGIRRDGKRRSIRTRTVASPDEPGRPIVGIAVSQAADISLPLDVEIDLGGVGGPSAGLAFALDILEELGHDVDRGRSVAATGELELDGTVDPVGGLRQKTIGARRAGVDVFLVPAGDNAEEARRYAAGLRIIPVENFQQALRALATLPEN